MTPSPYMQPAYRRSRRAYRVFCMLEYFISLLVTDVFLFKLLTHVGLSDSSIGVISSLITAACLFQLAALWLVRRIRHVKRWCVSCCMASQTVFVALYLLPMLPCTLGQKTVLAYAGILLGYLLSNAVASILFQWANSFVDPRRRATYSAGKEMLSLLGGMLFTFLLGLVMDRCEAAGHLADAFKVILALGVLINGASLAVLMQIDGRWPGKREADAPMRQVLAKLARNRGVRQIIVLSTLWSCAQYFTIGFLGSYKSKELMLSVGAVQLINILANLCRFLLTKPLGRLADRTSYASCIKLALAIAAVGFLAASLTTAATWQLIIVFTLLVAVSQAGIGQNLMNIVYDYVPEAYFAQASSLRNCIGGLCGFGASLIGSRILQAVQRRGNVLLGMEIYGQQLLAALSCLLTVIAACYVHFAMQKKGAGKRS